MSDGQPSFDLTREPWIPCERLDGTRVELGFEEVLAQAHELAGVHDESPLATAMIHRLLLAILHRVVDGPSSVRDWERLWKQEAFDAGQVREYLGRWRYRFDLFHRERPFMQVRGLEAQLAKEREGKNKDLTFLPASRLALERSAYAGDVNLLEHGGDEVPLSPAEAVKGLLGFMGFGPGGRIFNDSGYPTGCPLRPGAVVLARGPTLHRTLLLNLLLYTPERPIPRAGEDLPAWEQPLAAMRGKRAVRGWLDALTWQARRVELFAELRGTSPEVTIALTAAGAEPTGEWFEPMHAAIARDPKKPPLPLSFSPDRVVWRDSTALFAGAGQPSFRRPAVCTQIAQLVEDDVLDRSQALELQLLGLSGYQAVIRLWRSERMPLPTRLLVDPERLDAIRTGLAAAEETCQTLRSAVWQLCQKALAAGERDPDKKDVGALADRLDCDRRYWAAVGIQFPNFIRDAGASDSPEGALERWRADAISAARKAFRGAADHLGPQGRLLEATSIAEARLERGLRALTPQSEPRQQENSDAT